MPRPSRATAYYPAKNTPTTTRAPIPCERVRPSALLAHFRTSRRRSPDEPTAVAERPTRELLPTAFADYLRRQLPWPISLWRAFERLCRVERERLRPYRFGETAGGRNNDGNP